LPFCPVTTVLEMLVAWFVTVTDTPGSTAPVVSLAIPVIVPKVVCPVNTPTEKKQMTIEMAKTIGRIVTPLQSR
jgi:hypothetical protein